MSDISTLPPPHKPDRADTDATSILLILREALRPGTDISLSELHSRFAAVVRESRHEAACDVHREYLP